MTVGAYFARSFHRTVPRAQASMQRVAPQRSKDAASKTTTRNASTTTTTPVAATTPTASPPPAAATTTAKKEESSFLDHLRLVDEWFFLP